MASTLSIPTVSVSEARDGAGYVLTVHAAGRAVLVHADDAAEFARRLAAALARVDRMNGNA